MNKDKTNSEDKTVLSAAGYHSSPAENFSPGLILLAAGQSRRLENFPKQLLEFRGKTLLRRATENALAARCEKICVVLGANRERLKAEIADLPVQIVVNENWAEGMSSSIKAGLKRLLEIEPELSAAVIALCDQPLVDAKVINRLTAAFWQTPDSIVASEYAGTVGVPAIFPSAVFDELLNLSASGGAKQLIEKHMNSIAKVSVPEAVFDVDTRQDYENLISSNRGEHLPRK